MSHQLYILFVMTIIAFINVCGAVMAVKFFVDFWKGHGDGNMLGTAILIWIFDMIVVLKFLGGK